MFPSKFPWLHLFHIVSMVGLIGFTIWYTSNPLALFALLMLWSPPPLISPGQDDDEEDEPANAMGFGNGGPID